MTNPDIIIYTDVVRRLSQLLLFVENGLFEDSDIVGVGLWLYMSGRARHLRRLSIG